MCKINERRKALLNIIIKEFIKSARPVGSSAISKKGGFNLSPATIRNEMMALEKEGYIYQPHTSAGRAPTEKGYQFYIKNFLKEKKLAGKKMEMLAETVDKFKTGDEEMMKNLAKVMSDIADEAVFISLSPQHVYYTGLTHVFKQPEFEEQDLIHNMAEIIDHLDEVILEIFEEVDEDIKIMVGKENPFGENCAALLTKYSPKEPGMVGIIGPMRMFYENNIALLKEIQDLISKA